MNVAVGIFIMNAILFGGSITYEAAEVVAKNWYSFITERQETVNNVSVETFENDTTLYLFNFTEGGFVLISAESSIKPVLGYSENGEITGDRPPAFQWLLDSYSEQIQWAVLNNNENENSETEWQNILSNNINYDFSRNVDALITANWNQGNPWNDMCPEDSQGPGGNVWAGCTAVAMAQVMHYWSFPVHGLDSHGYIHPDYGYQYANFGETDYDFESMENDVATVASQLLLFHCGVSVDMQYSPSGSGAYVSTSHNAMVNYFGYDDSAIFLTKDDYEEYVWSEMLRDELDEGRPLVYRGDDPCDDGT